MIHENSFAKVNLKEYSHNLPKNSQKYYIISIATKSTLTMKNVTHLTIGIKFNVSFMRNNSFYEKKINFNHFSSQIEKMCTFSILATIFALSTNLKMQTFFIFLALYDLKVLIVLSKV